MPQGTFTGNYAGVPSLLYQPDIRKELIKRYQDDDFVNFLDKTGAWTKKTDDKFVTAFDSPLNIVVDTTGATVTNSGTATVTVTNLQGANANQLIVGKMVMFPNGLQGRVQTVTTTTLANDTVTIRSTAAGNPNLTLVAGGILVPYSNHQEEGSLQPAPEIWPLTTLTQLIGIFRKTGGITDVARARNNGSFRLEIGGKEAMGSWQAVRTLMSHRADIGYGLLMDEITDPNFTNTTPTVVGAQGSGVQFGRGLVPTIRDFGWNYSLTTLGTPTLADLEGITNLITAVRGADEYMLVGSRAAVARMSSFFKNLGSAGLTSVRMMVNGREVDLTVEEFTFGGRTFRMAAWNTFDNQQVLLTSNAVSKTLYAIPYGTAHVYSGGGKDVPYMGVGYLPVIHPGDGTEKQAEVHLGALAVNPTSGTAREDWVYETMCALDIANPYMFGSIRVLA